MVAYRFTAWRLCRFPSGLFRDGVHLLKPSRHRRAAPEEETELLTGHNDIPYYWLAWVNFILFGVGVSEWAQPSGIGHGFWQALGNPAVMIAFAALAEINLFLFWSSIGQLLNG